ncbi:MAG: succinylglutamate desuccinylase/aspartoacylase family protein, partial [Flavobacteriales bacterium]|nr:succinylglutamate desuccinylase/aspartoacylase family protein [Flavobacteriales bacterium]
EYEGPIALFDLANQIKAEEISGRVIIVPGMNYPAFRAGKRTSPIDGGNMEGREGENLVQTRYLVKEDKDEFMEVTVLNSGSGKRWETRFELP